MTDDSKDLPALVPFAGRNLIAKWPEMVPDRYRQRWKTDRRSFTFTWLIPAECDARPIGIALRNNAVVFEVLSAGITVGDGLEKRWCQAGSAVAVSLSRFDITPAPDLWNDVRLRVHVIGTVPFRGLILSNPAYSKMLERLRGTLPGIFDLAGPQLREIKRRADPGEEMVVRYSQIPAFLRFLATIPRALYRHEGGLKNRR